MSVHHLPPFRLFTSLLKKGVHLFDGNFVSIRRNIIWTEIGWKNKLKAKRNPVWLVLAVCYLCIRWGMLKHKMGDDARVTMHMFRLNGKFAARDDTIRYPESENWKGHAGYPNIHFRYGHVELCVNDNE